MEYNSIVHMKVDPKIIEGFVSQILIEMVISAFSDSFLFLYKLQRDRWIMSLYFPSPFHRQTF